MLELNQQSYKEEIRLFVECQQVCLKKTTNVGQAFSSCSSTQWAFLLQSPFSKVPSISSSLNISSPFATNLQTLGSSENTPFGT